jgi:flagellar hook-basal body complex protein FliE
MRIINIVLTDLASSKLKAEEKLQRLLNNKDSDLDDVLVEIKKQLREISLLETMITKWNDYTINQKDNK